MLTIITVWWAAAVGIQWVFLAALTVDLPTLNSSSSQADHLSMVNGPVGPIAPPSQLQNDFVNLWEKALNQYTIQTGLDLQRTSLASELLKCKSPDGVFRVLESGKETIQAFRNHAPKVRAVLAPIMGVAQTAFNTSGSMALVSSSRVAFANVSKPMTSALSQQEV